MKLLLFCVESNKLKQIDWIYIESLIRHFYIEDRDVVRRPVFMNGRSNYASGKVQKEIQSNHKKGYTNIHVLFCVDTDHYEMNTDQKTELERIVAFCKSNRYELIWFCHDIEEVLIGRSVPDSEKLAFAKRFANLELYKKIDERKLTKAAYHKGYSNIKTVLDKFLCQRNLGDSDPQ